MLIVAFNLSSHMFCFLFKDKSYSNKPFFPFQKITKQGKNGKKRSVK